MKKRYLLLLLGLPSVLVGSVLVIIPMLFVAVGASSCAPTGSMATATDGVSIASWNVCGASCGRWAERSKLVTRQISRELPDVVALQEGTWGKGKRGYTFNGLKSIGYATKHRKPPYIGRYIFYRPEKLTASSAGSFSLGSHHGMAWTVLKSKETGKVFTVVDVHLDPRTSSAGDARRAIQMRQGMSKLATKTRGDVVYAGDFNSNKSRASDEPAKILKAAGYVNTRTVAKTKTNATVNSARGRSTNAAVKKHGNQTDQIWIPKDAGRVEAWNQVVDAKNGRYSWPFISDHNMIVATVALGEKERAGNVPAAVASAVRPDLSKITGGIGKFNKGQVQIARTIIAVGQKREIPKRGQVIAVMTSIAESSLTNVPHGDAVRNDTIGIIQIGPEHGTYAQRMDPAWSAGNFYKRLLAVNGWTELEPTIAAHRAQRNADPNHYTPFWSDAKLLYSKIAGEALGDVDETTSPGCAAGDTRQTNYSSGADCDFKGYNNPRSCKEALEWAANIASKSACQRPQGGTWRRFCLGFVANAYGQNSSGPGHPTAIAMYQDMERRGLISKSKNIPAGALVYFKSGDPAGHVALYNGNGKAWSNDYVRGGCIDLTPMSQMGAGGRYLGWSPPAFYPK